MRKDPKRFCVSDNVYQATLPSYDAASDPHCKSWTRSKTFTRHWTAMTDIMVAQQQGTERIQLALAQPPKETPDILKSGSSIVETQRRILSAKCRAQPTFSLPRPPTTPYAQRITTPRTPNRPRVECPKEYTQLFAFRPHSGKSPTPAVTRSSNAEMTELTKTFARVLEQSEKYYRREFTAAFEKESMVLLQRVQTYQKFLRLFIAERTNMQQTETHLRHQVEVDEEKDWSEIGRLRDRNEKYTKQNEEVLPKCRVLQHLEAVQIPEISQTALLCDIRWLGSMALGFSVLLFDASNRYLATVTTESGAFKDPSSNQPLVRSWGDFVFLGAEVKGYRQTVELTLQNIGNTCPVHKLVFCIFNASVPGMPLNDVRRCYLTIRKAADPIRQVLSTTPLDELVAISVPMTSKPTAVVAATLTKGPQWYLQSLCTFYTDIGTPERLVGELKRSVFTSHHSLIEAWDSERCRMLKTDLLFFQRVGRGALELLAKDVFDRILEEFEFSRPDKKVKLKKPRKSRATDALRSPMDQSIQWWDSVPL